MTDKVCLSSFDSHRAKGVVVYCVHRVPDELYSKTGRDRVDSIPCWTPYATPPLALLESVLIPSLNPKPSWGPSASWTPATHNHLRGLWPAGPLPPTTILGAFSHLD